MYMYVKSTIRFHLQVSEHTKKRMDALMSWSLTGRHLEFSLSVIIRTALVSLSPSRAIELNIADGS